MNEETLNRAMVVLRSRFSDVYRVVQAEADPFLPLDAVLTDYESHVTTSLSDRLRSLADELLEPMICRTPAYGAPGLDHCAACCYGTGLVVTCPEDVLIATAADAMKRAAAAVDTSPATEEPT